MWQVWFQNPEVQASGPHYWADEEGDDRVTAELQTGEEMSYTDGVLASGFGYK